MLPNAAVETESLARAGRFAPSITGSAHPGTLLAALLAWLDARSSGCRFVLRLEDLDHTRLREGQREGMVQALTWLGLDWDELVLQSSLAEQHEAAMDALAKEGRLYPCTCSRKDRLQGARVAPDGGFAYDNRCRGKALPPAGWRASKEPLRVQLPDTRVLLRDLSGLDLSQTPATEMGDPIVRRRDGVFAYHLVVVVDDAASGVTQVVRGRDLASSTATQVQLHELLRLEPPSYRHHFLLLEGETQKLAKMHGSLPFEELARRFSPDRLCGVLAALAGLQSSEERCTPGDLLGTFHWDKVRESDCVFGSDLVARTEDLETGHKP